MGMSASQARLLSLTDQLHNIGRKEQHYAHVKETLTREAQEISRRYNMALQNKVLKWSNNAGVDYVDLTYSTLMRPNTANGNKPVLLTNDAGKIVVDGKYIDYAKMISPNGKAVGDWKDNPNRLSILSQLTGISASSIAQSGQYEERIAALEDRVVDLHEACTTNIKTEDFIRQMGAIYGHQYQNYGDTSVGNDVRYDLYNYSMGGGHNTKLAKEYQGAWVLGTDSGSAKTGLKNILDQITSNISPYLEASDLEGFKNACEKTYSTFVAKIGVADVDCLDRDDVSRENTNNGGKYCVNLYYLIEDLMQNFTGGGQGSFLPNSNEKKFVIVPGGTEGQAYKEYEAACVELDELRNQSGTLLDSAQEQKIEFYDLLFTAICDNGWVEDYQVSDQEYLNQMLQNNAYFITTMYENEPVCNCEHNDDLMLGLSKYEYNIDLWSNTDNIFAVNDENARQEALTQCEYEKSLVSRKEKHVDERMKNLETQQNAIKQEMEGIKQVQKDNIEANFNMFT